MSLRNKLQRGFERIEKWYKPPLDPLRVSHQQSWRWFEHRRDIQDRLIEAILPYVPTNGVIVDVGANIGYFSHRLMTRVRFQGLCHLFEPLPHLAELCRFTFRDNAFQTHIHPVALSDTVAEISLYTSTDGNIGWNTLVAEKRLGQMKAIPVSTQIFDDLGIEEPSFIKIDVEGFEYKVLRGMRRTLSQAAHKPVILCEIGWGKSHPQWADELETFKMIETFGYQTTDLAGSPLQLADLEQTTDILFVPLHRNDARN